MDIQIFGVVVLAMGIMSLNLPYQWAIYGLAVCSLFGSASTIAFPALGGLAILPANLFLLFFALRAFQLGGRDLWQAVGAGRPGFWLACLCLCAAVGAVFLPRALAGTTYVFAINRGDTDPNQAALQPLGPVSGNLSQMIYCCGELVLYCAMSVFLRRRDAYGFFAKAIMLLAALNIAAAAIDLASYEAGIDVLSAVKTADYVMHGDEELGGLKRIVGTFSESSAFSGFTLPLFAFTINLWLLGYRSRVNSLLSAASGALLLMSTSATAYVGALAYLACLLLGRPQTVAPRARSRKRRLCLVLACAVVLALIYAATFRPDLLDVVTGFFGQTLLDKSDSDSGVERAAWNLQAVQNVIDTYGMGVGIGSARASSFLLVLLSNLGVVGALCFALFFVGAAARPMARAYPAADRAVGYAARQAMIAALIVASVSGTVFDLGSCFYLFAAVAASLSVRRRRANPDPDLATAGADPVRPGGRPFARALDAVDRGMNGALAGGDDGPEGERAARGEAPSGHDGRRGHPSGPGRIGGRGRGRVPAWPNRP
ncbi:hypothetical protein CY652_04070 [Burkholderia sp. WAC0059]|uniref:hypothetical protein n=1 Tax=Burkholderia sp. WAC0059 TaxID=2066022 RepID=UPI000C7F3C83|nr:hypothetical protein [Burkholderia sp. WAC0059]PLZ03576.1 hypothetical protein CY652_04070 [Burkholderia sp. WAC0059]